MAKVIGRCNDYLLMESTLEIKLPVEVQEQLYVEDIVYTL